MAVNSHVCYAALTVHWLSTLITYLLNLHVLSVLNSSQTPHKQSLHLSSQLKLITEWLITEWLITEWLTCRWCLKLWRYCTIIIGLIGATESGSEARLTERLVGKSLDVTSSRRPVKVNSDVSSSRRPDDLCRDMTSSRRPGVKTSDVTSVSDALREKELELQQQMYISQLLDSKSSSRRHAATRCQHNHGAVQSSSVI